jgi:hypothetical protein
VFGAYFWRLFPGFIRCLFELVRCVRKYIINTKSKHQYPGRPKTLDQITRNLSSILFIIARLQAAEAGRLDAEKRLADREVELLARQGATQAAPSALEADLQRKVAELRRQQLLLIREHEETAMYHKREALVAASLREEKQVLSEEVSLLRLQRQRQTSHISLLKAQLWAASLGAHRSIDPSLDLSRGALGESVGGGAGGGEALFDGEITEQFPLGLEALVGGGGGGRCNQQLALDAAPAIDRDFAQVHVVTELREGPAAPLAALLESGQPAHQIGGGAVDVGSDGEGGSGGGGMGHDADAGGGREGGAGSGAGAGDEFETRQSGRVKGIALEYEKLSAAVPTHSPAAGNSPAQTVSSPLWKTAREASE